MDRALWTGIYRLIIPATIAVVLCVVESAGAQTAAPAGQRSGAARITVADIIGWTRFAGDGYVDVGVRSPDGEQSALVVTRGDVARNVVVYTLLILHERALLPAPRVDTVVTLASASNRPAVSGLRWLADGRTLAFLGERGEQGDTLPQVYTVDTRSRQVTQRTHHPTVVTAFDIAANDGRVVYIARPPIDTTRYVTWRQRGFVVGPTQLAGDVIAGRWGEDGLPQLSQLFLVRHFGDQPVRLPSPDSTSVRWCWDDYLSLSPTGTTVLLGCLPRRIPPRWAAYRNEFVRQLVEDGARFPQYFVLDLVGGKLKPLMDAPTIYPGFVGQGIPWAPDGHAVVLGNTFLPLDVAAPSERAWRMGHRAVAEIDVHTGAVTVITRRDSLRAVRWDAATNTIELAPGGGIGNIELGRVDPMLLVRYRKTRAGWREVQAPPRRAAASVLTIEEGMNTPPRLVAVAPQTGERRVVYDPNPEILERFSFAREQVVHWTTRAGVRWDGGLYLPPGRDPGRRYPLVIQTHAFDSTAWAPDGPFSTANAAQALASAGIMVLQIGYANSTVVTPREGPANQEGIEAAIDHLDSLGLIDRERVGLIGFSRTCFHVLYTLTHSSYPIRAAAITDGVDFGYLQYLLWGRLGIDQEYAGINGGPPWGGNFGAWRERAPGFNLDRVTAPLRLEAITTGSVLGEWEPYAGLLLQHKPAELFVIPGGEHILVKPWERLASQGGNADWFRFWLKNEEDPDPAKREQYARWRELRELQQRQTAGDTAGMRPASN